MAALETTFIEGGVKNGYTEKGMKELFHQIEGFANYGFNLSHAVCYSYITCQTAWLSYYYPLEFYTAALTIDAGKTDDVRKYIKAIKERGYNILPPNINKSEDGFIIDGESIIFGLNAIKGVGATVSKKIIRNRPKSGYRSLGHFIQRNKDLVNSKVLESYAKGGVFSDFGNKESILTSVRNILDWNSVLKDIAHYTIFDLCKIENGEYIDSCLINSIDVEDKLFYEIESLGLYINKHPMEDYILDKDNCTDISKIQEYEDGDPIITVGTLSCVDIRKTKAKLNMASFNLDTDLSTIKCICFPQAYSKHIDVFNNAEGKLVVVEARVKEENDENSLIINKISDDIKGYAHKIVGKKKDLNKEMIFMLNDKIKFILKKPENK